MKHAHLPAAALLATALAMPAQEATAEQNLVLDQLHTLDFNQCRSAAETMAGVLVDTENHGYSAQWGPDTNDDMLMYTVENTWDDNSSNITVGAVAPTTAGDCDVLRTKVMIANRGCSTMANDWDLQREGSLNARWIKYTSDDASTETYMHSVGSSCVIKEVEHVVGMPVD